VEELRKAISHITVLEKEVEELKKKLEEVSKPKATDNLRKRK
jgi:FtsZ-binding cell division protein ZapB